MQTYHPSPIHGHHSDPLLASQRATATNIRIRSPSDARVIFHAVLLNILPIVTRRLDTDERSSITAGSVYVWEERGPHAEATGLGIERWTDGIRWGPSRVRDGFLFYHEKESRHSDSENMYDSDPISPIRLEPSRCLIKQTYSVFVDTERGRKKWHLIAYFTEQSLDYLRTVNDYPQLASLLVPHGKYRSARSAKGRIRDQQADDDFPVPPPAYDPIHPQLPSVSYVTQAHHSSSPEVVMRPIPSIRNEYPRFHFDDQRPPPSPATGSKHLAPLAYLENIAPRPRHPVDEKVLMMFSPGLT